MQEQFSLVKEELKKDILKKLILYSLLFIIILSFVNADDLDITDFVECYTFDDSSLDGTNYTGFNGNELQPYGDPTTGYSTGTIGEAVYLDGAGDYYCGSATGYSTGSSNRSIIGKFYVKTDENYLELFLQGNNQATINEEFNFNLNNVDNNFVIGKYGGDSTSSDWALDFNIWRMLGYVVTGTSNIRMVKSDGTTLSSSDETLSGFDTANNIFCIGDGWNNANPEMYVDEIIVFDRSLTTEQLNKIQEAWFTNMTSLCVGSEAPAPTQPSLILKTDLINNTINYNKPTLNFTVNGTVSNADSDIVNISFYQQGLFNRTILDVNITTGLKYNITLPIKYEGYYNISFNASNSQLNASSGVFIYKVDLLEPYFSSNIVNNSVYYENIHTIKTINITGVDTNLYYMNFSLFRYNATSETLLNYTNITTTNTSETLTIKFNVNELLNGTYRADFFLADSHTKENVSDMNWYWDNDKLHIENLIFEGTKLKTINKKRDLVTYFYKDTDRYKMKITFNDNSLEHSFYLTAPNWKYIGEVYGYKGHFITLQEKRWLDFMGKNVKTVDITDLGNDRYLIDVKHYYSTDEIEFESIGDLNTVSGSYYFNISKGHTFYLKDIIANTTISNFTTKVFDSSLSLLQERNSTTGNITLNLTGNYILNFSATDYVTNTTNTTLIEGSKDIVYLYAANSLYLFIYDEQNNTLIDDRNITIDVINYDNTSKSYTTETGSIFKSGFNVGSYEINYKAKDYTPRSYYTDIIGGDTQSIDLYLLVDNNQDSTHQYKNIEVLDESASSLSDATVKMQRYFISENAWKTVEMSNTNDEGEGVLFAELYDVNYRFVIDYGGTTRKTTSQTKLDTRNLFFSISLITSGMDTFYEIGDATADITFDNDTKLYTYDFNAGTLSIDNGRLEVYRLDDTEKITYCNNTLSAQSGGITCNISSYTGLDGTFIAHGYMTTSSDGTEYLTSIDTRSFNEDYITYGLNGLLMSMIIIGTLTFIGLYNPTVAIGFSLFGLLITKLIGLLYMDFTFLIGMVVVGIIFIMELKT